MPAVTIITNQIINGFARAIKLNQDSILLWWGWLGLNQRPIGYEPTALTAELHPLNRCEYSRFAGSL